MPESKLTLEEKYEIGMKHSRDKINSTILSKEYNIPESTVRWYGSKVRKGDPFFAKSSRPSILEPEHEIELKNILTSNTNSNINIEDEINKLLNKTCEIRGIQRDTIQPIQKGTITHLENKVLKENKRKYHITVPRKKYITKKMKLNENIITTSDDNILILNKNQSEKKLKKSIKENEKILKQLTKESEKSKPMRQIKKHILHNNNTITKTNNISTDNISNDVRLLDNMKKFKRTSKQKVEISIKDLVVSDSEDDDE